MNWMAPAGVRRRDPGAPAAGHRFRPGRLSDEETFLRARIARPLINLLERVDLRFGQTIGRVRSFADEHGRIERAGTRILDQAVGHAVEAIAGRHDGALDDWELRGRDRALRRRQERAFVPDEGGEQARPVVRRSAGQDAVEVFWKALRLHQRFAAAVGAPGEVAPLRVPAVERADDRFGLHRGLMHGAIPEVDQFLRMSDGPVRAAATFMAVVGAGDGVAAAQGLCKGGGVDGACPAAVAFLPVLGVPGGRRRQPEGKLDIGIAAWTNDAANVAMGGYRARTRRRRTLERRAPARRLPARSSPR